MNRRRLAKILTAAAALAVVGLTSGCTPQQYLAFTTHTVTQSPLKVDGQPTDDLGYYDPSTRTIHLDPLAIGKYDGPTHATYDWVLAHEGGHAIADDIGLTIGSEPYPTVPDQPWPPAERAAQCVAEVELGHGPPWTNNAQGYWDCSAHWVAVTRTLMAQHGIEVRP